MADQRPIGYWLRLVDRLIDERFAETLDEHGVTRRQWELLGLLTRGQAASAGLDGESSEEHLAELVESGWITVGERGYAITERGAVAFTRLEQVVAENRADATKGLTPDQYDETLRTLEVIALNLGWQDDGSAQREQG